MIRRFALSLLLAWPAFAGVNVPDWVTLAAQSKVPQTDAAAVVLLDETQMNIQSADEIVTRYRRVVKILTAAGRDLGYVAVSFDNASKLKSFRAWSIDAKGQRYEVKERDAMEVSPFDFELYSDARSKVLRIPASDIGSVIAYEYEKRERPYVLHTTWQFQEDLPVVTARLSVTMPNAWAYDARWFGGVAPPPSAASSAEGGGATLKSAGPLYWELKDIPEIAFEPGRPSSQAIAGRVGIHFIPPSPSSVHRTWGDVAKWFAALAAPRLGATPEVQAKAKELTSGSSDPVRALAKFSQKDVRYVAVEIGIGGYQPHAAADVFRNRYGDCKDKATLLKAMLKEIGIESYYVIVHTTRGVVDPQFPSIHSFNHVILAVAAPPKAKDLYAVVQHPKLGALVLFDPTSTLTPFGYLPSYLQESRGLLVTPDGGELIDLPKHAPEANTLRRSAKLRLDGSGHLAGDVTEVRTGWLAAEMRGSLHPMTAQERVRFLESTLAYHLSNYTTSGVAFENLDDVDSDLVIKYSIAAPSYATHVADMTLVRPRVLGQKPESILDLGKRKYGYVTSGPSVQTDDIEIALPPGVGVDELPEAVKLSTPMLQYSSQAKYEAGILRYNRQYALQTWYVDREKLGELNKAFSQILADERASAVLK